MKTFVMTSGLLLAIGLGQQLWAQSTTGSRSGGSTASTGTGYLTEGKRPATTAASSMTIADEGSSRDYMYVPPKPARNRSASPDGSDNTSTNSSASKQAPASQPASGKKMKRVNQ